MTQGLERTKQSDGIGLTDVVIMCRWLTAFIFSAQDYNWHSCYANAPPGMACSRKKANESFIFLTLYVLSPPFSQELFCLCFVWMCEGVWLTRSASLLSSACSSKCSRSGHTVRRTAPALLMKRTGMLRPRRLRCLVLPNLT